MRRRRPRHCRTRMPSIDGLVLVDKPAGVTSHDVVAIARRALSVRRIGHGGTLDPFATGLLVLLVGRATRLLPWLEGEPKVYEATIRFGVETDTDDHTGTAVRTAPLPAPDRVVRAVAGLTGALDQVPPAYSAKQVAGRRAHTAARRGRPLSLDAARVVVHRWTIRAQRDAELDVTIACGAGTYIRALARDLGRAADSAAHLAALRRLQSGPFTVAHAADLDALREGRAVVHAPLAAVPSLPVVALDAAALRRVTRGQDVARSLDAGHAALVDARGALVAIAERRDESWHPQVVLGDA